MDFSFLDVLFDDREVTYGQMRRYHDQLHHELRMARGMDRKLVAALEAMLRENQEMRLRVGILIRLLIEKGVMTAEEFAGEVAEARAALAKAAEVAPRKALAPGTMQATAMPKAKLPKPPKKLPGAPQA